MVDLGLPDGDGAELIRELCEGEPRVPVLVLADHLNLERCELAIRAGADDVLTKGGGLGRILDALRRLGERER